MKNFNRAVHWNKAQTTILQEMKMMVQHGMAPDIILEWKEYANTIRRSDRNYHSHKGNTTRKNCY